MQILLLESDRLLSQNIARALKKAGHKVDWQVDAQEAVNAADTQPPEVVIMELFLAERTGVEFLYEFRSYPDWSAVPAIVLSAMPENDARVYIDELEKLNVKHFFYKPATSLEQIVEAVNQLDPTAK